MPGKEEAEEVTARQGYCEEDYEREEHESPDWNKECDRGGWDEEEEEGW